MNRDLLIQLSQGLPVSNLPINRGPTPNIAHASKKTISLSKPERKVGFVSIFWVISFDPAKEKFNVFYFCFKTKKVGHFKFLKIFS